MPCIKKTKVHKNIYWFVWKTFYTFLFHLVHYLYNLKFKAFFLSYPLNKLFRKAIFHCIFLEIFLMLGLFHFYACTNILVPLVPILGLFWLYKYRQYVPELLVGAQAGTHETLEDLTRGFAGGTVGTKPHSSLSANGNTGSDCAAVSLRVPGILTLPRVASRLWTPDTVANTCCCTVAWLTCLETALPFSETSVTGLLTTSSVAPRLWTPGTVTATCCCTEAGATCLRTSSPWAGAGTGVDWAVVMTVLEVIEGLFWKMIAEVDKGMDCGGLPGTECPNLCTGPTSQFFFLQLHSLWFQLCLKCFLHQVHSCLKRHFLSGLLTSYSHLSSVLQPL